MSYQFASKNPKVFKKLSKGRSVLDPIPRRQSKATSMPKLRRASYVYKRHELFYGIYTCTVTELSN